DLGDVRVQSITNPGGEQGIVAFIEAVIDEEDGDTRQNEVASLVQVALKEVLGEDISVRRVDVVGPTVSGELVQRGVTALVVAIGLMLAYIWFRFEWQFSIGAILALTHDVILTIGVFAVTQLEFTLAIIAALLTIIGYSMNDTVVIYDRIRENLRKYKQMPLKDVINLSVNQTLGRTIMTSLTTLLAVVALFVFGGSVLRGFSFALIWGVIVGTYSTVYIASPLLLQTGVKRDWSETGSKVDSATAAS
ncbi:MAG: protein translocase subunit SecF, partial [Pseudomonadota bacterium]